jgi:hypothetical protein
VLLCAAQWVTWAAALCDCRTELACCGLGLLLQGGSAGGGQVLGLWSAGQFAAHVCDEGVGICA